MDMLATQPFLRLEHRDWTEHAICKHVTHVFFGPPAERPERKVEREAIAYTYCMACPVLDDCREYARQNREHGFWGGENEEERAAAGYLPLSSSRRAVLTAYRDGNERRAALADGEVAEEPWVPMDDWLGRKPVTPGDALDTPAELGGPDQGAVADRRGEAGIEFVSFDALVEGGDMEFQDA